MKKALLFPGQGAQFASMGKDLAETFPRAREIFGRANEVLGFDLAAVCFNGPQEELNRTDISQPAIVAHSWALSEVLCSTPRGAELFGSASAMAGLSLGEYSALAAAGAMTWEDALALVHKRGQFMQEACDAVASTMASILNLEAEKLEAICKEASALGVCVMANFNAPGQIVIAGTKEAVARACELAKTAGARRCVELQVAGAFHSPLMEPARERLAREIDAVPFRDPQIPVLANVTGEPVTTATEAKDLLVKQLTSPVRWEASMRRLVNDGFGEYYEIGPGNVLTGLLKKVAAEERKLNIGNAAELQAFVG